VRPRAGVSGVGESPPVPPNDRLADRLYRNDLIVRADGTRRLHFTDVTERSGLGDTNYGVGVATYSPAVGSNVPLVYAAETIDVTRAFISEFNSKNPATASVAQP